MAGFYLIKNNSSSEKIYLDAAYLKSLICNSTSTNSVVSSAINSNEKLSIQPNEVSEEYLVDLITRQLSTENISKFSGFLLFNKKYVLSLFYLVYYNRINADEIVSLLEMTNYRRRDELFIKYLSRESNEEENDIFSALESGLCKVSNPIMREDTGAQTIAINTYLKNTINYPALSVPYMAQYYSDDYKTALYEVDAYNRNGNSISITKLINSNFSWYSVTESSVSQIIPTFNIIEKLVKNSNYWITNNYMNSIRVYGITIGDAALDPLSDPLSLSLNNTYIDTYLETIYKIAEYEFENRETPMAKVVNEKNRASFFNESLVPAISINLSESFFENLYGANFQYRNICKTENVMAGQPSIVNYQLNLNGYSGDVFYEGDNRPADILSKLKNCVDDTSSISYKGPDNIVSHVQYSNNKKTLYETLYTHDYISPTNEANLLLESTISLTDFQKVQNYIANIFLPTNGLYNNFSAIRSLGGSISWNKAKHEYNYSRDTVTRRNRAISRLTSLANITTSWQYNFSGDYLKYPNLDSAMTRSLDRNTLKSLMQLDLVVDSNHIVKEFGSVSILNAVNTVKEYLKEQGYDLNDYSISSLSTYTNKLNSVIAEFNIENNKNCNVFELAIAKEIMINYLKYVANSRLTKNDFENSVLRISDGLFKSYKLIFYIRHMILQLQYQTQYTRLFEDAYLNLFNVNTYNNLIFHAIYSGIINQNFYLCSSDGTRDSFIKDVLAERGIIEPYYNAAKADLEATLTKLENPLYFEALLSDYYVWPIVKNMETDSSWKELGGSAWQVGM